MGIFYVSIPISLVNAIAFSEGVYAFPLIVGLFFSQCAMILVVILRVKL